MGKVYETSKWRYPDNLGIELGLERRAEVFMVTRLTQYGGAHLYEWTKSWMIAFC